MMDRCGLHTTILWSERFISLSLLNYNLIRFFEFVQIHSKTKWRFTHVVKFINESSFMFRTTHDSRINVLLNYWMVSCKHTAAFIFENNTNQRICNSCSGSVSRELYVCNFCISRSKKYIYMQIFQVKKFRAINQSLHVVLHLDITGLYVWKLHCGSSNKCVYARNRTNMACLH